MTVTPKTIVTFVATGTAATHQVTASGQNPVLSGDPIIEITDVTASGPVTNGFGNVVVAASGGPLLIIESGTQPGIAGHVCMALIGSR